MKPLVAATNIVLSASLTKALRIPAPKPACTLPCPSSAICIADPRPRCTVPSGFCGGIAGFSCEAENYYCVDDPADDCYPEHGGFDCGGVCVQKSEDNCS